MTQRRLSGLVDGQPEQAIGLLADPGHWPAWRTTPCTVRDISDEPIQPASSWVEQHDLRGRAATLVARVVHLDPMHAFAYTGTGDGIELRARWTATPEGARCRVTQEISVRTSGVRNFLAHTTAHLLQDHDALIDQLRVRLHRLHPSTQPHKEIQA